jgi:hypothetical protein
MTDEELKAGGFFDDQSGLHKVEEDLLYFRASD